MARVPSFLRKGATTPTAVADNSGGDEAEAYSDDTPIAKSSETQNEADIAVCPKCGCCFNDDSGTVIPEGHPQHPGSSGGTPAGGPTGEGDATPVAAKELD